LGWFPHHPERSEQQFMHTQPKNVRIKNHVDLT
jgi:hypothetical protein